MLSIMLIALFLLSAVCSKAIVFSKPKVNTPNAIAGNNKPLGDAKCGACKVAVAQYLTVVEKYHPKNSTAAGHLVCYTVMQILEWKGYPNYLPPNPIQQCDNAMSILFSGLSIQGIDQLMHDKKKMIAYICLVILGWCPNYITSIY